MRHFLAVRNLLAMLALIAALLAGVWLLISLGADQLIIPTPEMTAEGYVNALAAERIEGAYTVLSQELQQQVGKPGLQALAKNIQASHQGIENAHGLSSSEQGDTATAQVEIEWGTLQKETIQIPLVKEHGIWKIARAENGP